MRMDNKKQKTILLLQYLECPMGKNMKYHYRPRLLNQVEKAITPKYRHLYMKTRYMAGKYKYGKRAMETRNNMVTSVKKAN